MNGPNTHGDIIQFEYPSGEKAVAFIDGVPDKCDHQWDGEGYHFNRDGQFFPYSKVPDPDVDMEAFMQWHNEHNICGGCVSCSKCGKPYEPPLF